jgi:hypothetical protein
MSLPRPAQLCLLAIVALSLLRLAAAALLPLSADEAYYWLWSRHLAAGYFDHPPAIAFVIRSGTLLFGDTPLGLRFVPFLLSLMASALVWRSAAILLGDDVAGARASLFFNLTLMISVETLAATPDAPAVAAAAAFLYAVARLWQSDNDRWWLGVGVAGGLSLLSKYTGLFLGATFLLAALVFPSAVYFLVHSLHDRIQGNWPCFLYPALAVAAAEAFARSDWSGWTESVWRASRRLAIPVAAILLVGVYAQALVGVVPLGRSDPLARLLAVGMPDVTKNIERLAAQDQVQSVLTTDYASTAWLSFYLPSHPTIVQLNEEQRYPDAPRADAALLAQPLLYVVETRLDRHDFVAGHFAQVTPIAHVDRLRRGVAIAHYVIYRVAGFHGAPLGRTP